MLKEGSEVVEVSSGAGAVGEGLVELGVVEVQDEAKDAAPNINNTVLIEEAKINIGVEVINVEEKGEEEIEVEDPRVDVLPTEAETQIVAKEPAPD
ncbi:hypothetical protein Dimus_029280, partial [Dionaea muscipula]